MAEVAKGIIDIEINTGSAASALQALQAQINAFNIALSKSNKTQGAFSGKYSRELQDAINKTGLFTAETIKLQTAAATLDKTLSKGKTSLGQYFSARFNKDGAIAAETMSLASERARRLQTQFIATSGAANGFQDALAVRPIAAFSSQVAVAGQRAEVMSAMFKQGTTQLINFGKNVQWAGRQLMVGFTVPLTIFGAVAGKTFMELEKQVVGFKKVYGDLFTTPADLEKNLEAVKGLAGEYTKYGIAVKDTIGLAAQAAAAGRQGAELTDSVTQATRLATLGQMDQNAALETTISLQSAFKLSGQDLADTINFLNMVENQTVVSLQDIATAIPRVAPVISGLGGDVKDLTVFLAAMQEGGVDASEGANALKSGLASLINPTKQATAMLSGFGINLEAIIQTNKGDLMATVQSFAQALGTLDEFSRQQALEQVFGKFQYAKLGALFENISREGSQAQQVIATLGYTTEQLASTADKELKTIEESFGVQLTGAVERFKLAIAPIGEIFVKLAIPLVNLATKIAEGFNGLSDGQKKFAAIGAVIIGVVVPAVTMLTGLFLNLVGTLAKMTQGVTLFGKGLISGGPMGAIKALTQSSKYLSLAEMDASMAAQQLAGSNEILNATLLKQITSANGAAGAIGNLAKAYGAMIATQGAAASKYPEIFGVAGASGAAAKTSQVRIRGIQKRNSGGPIFMSNGTTVPGVGNTDTVPAMLTPGEFVVNKEATKNNLGLLHNINNTKGPQGLNAGGKAKGVQYLSTAGVVRKMMDDLMNVPGGFASLGGQSSRRLSPHLGFRTRSLRSGRASQASPTITPKIDTIPQVSRLRTSPSDIIAQAFRGSKVFEKFGITTGIFPAQLNKLLSTNANGARAKDVQKYIEIAGEDFLEPFKLAYIDSGGPGSLNTSGITENILIRLRGMRNNDRITDASLRGIIDEVIGSSSVHSNSKEVIEHVARMRTDPSNTAIGRIAGLNRNTVSRAEKLGISVPEDQRGRVTTAAARQALIETAEKDISRNINNNRLVEIIDTGERPGDKIVWEARDVATNQSLVRFKSGDSFPIDSVPEYSGARSYLNYKSVDAETRISERLEEALSKNTITPEEYSLFTKEGFNLSHMNAGGQVPGYNTGALVAKSLRRRVRPGKKERRDQLWAFSRYIEDPKYIRDNPEDMSTLAGMLKPLNQTTRATRATVLGSTKNPELPYAQQKRIVAAIKEGRYEDLFGMKLKFKGPGSYTTRRETDFSPFIGDLSNPTLKSFSQGFMGLKSQKEEIARLRKIIRSGKFKKLTPGTFEYARELGMTGLWSPARSFRPGGNPPIGSDYTIEQVLANKLRDYSTTKTWVDKTFPDKKIQQLFIDEMVGSGTLALNAKKYRSTHPEIGKRRTRSGGLGGLDKIIEKENEILLGNRTSQITGVATDLRTKLPSLITQSGAQRFNKGNIVPGTGNTDTVPAMLTPGEFVVNKESTKKNYDLLTAINNSQKLNKGGVAGVQYLNEGELVKGVKRAGSLGSVGSMGGGIAGFALAEKMGITSMSGQFAASIAASIAAQKLLTGATLALTKTTKSAGARNAFYPRLSALGPSIAKYAGIINVAGAGIALAGFAAYKLNKQIDDASKAGGKLAAAMYGTAESTNAIAKTFGKQTRAQQALVAATEKATGETTSEESQQVSIQFMESDAGKALLKDISFVQASGKDAAIALRNQLSQAIIAGAITPEEARAIAIDIGTALDSQRLAVEVSGKISDLMGPNGEKLTAQNILKIQAEISPKLDISEIKNDAKNAYNDLNNFAKLFSIFKGGSAGFENQFKLEEVITVNNSALSAQLNTVEFLNAAFKEGTVGLEDYKKALDLSKVTTNDILDINARAIGSKSNEDLIAKAEEQRKSFEGRVGAFKGRESSLMPIAQPFAAIPYALGIGKGEELQAIDQQKNQVKTILEESEAYSEDAVDKIIKDFEKIGDTSWGKLLTAEWSPVDAEILLNFKTKGLTTEEIDELLFKLGVLETLPSISTVIDFKNPNIKSVEEFYSMYEQLKIAADEGPLTQEVLVKATGMDIFDSEIMALINSVPSSIAVDIIATVAFNDEETSRKLNSREDYFGSQDEIVKSGLVNAFKKAFDKIGDGGTTNQDGGKGQQEDLLKSLMERFRLQEMLIDKQAEASINRVKQLNREIQLEERQVSLRQKALEQLSKKEEEVNEAYNLRVEALDKVSESNSRISEQQRSATSLASALASGDIAGAANIANEMQEQSAQYQIEDARAALEKQRQVDLDALTVSINGKLMTRKGIEFEIEAIQDRIYNKGIELQGVQDKLLGFEQRKLDVAKEREKVETRMYLLEQQKNILDLKKLNRKGKLDPADKQSLAEYTKFYNQNVDMYNAANPGANVARMANGGIAYKGSTEAPPAMKMAFGSTVPGNGMTDKVSALLTPGEFVVRKPVADKNRGFLQALNGQVFPGMGSKVGIPKNNFLDGIGSPRFSIPESGVANVPVANTNVVSTSSPMYNSTYNVNVNVSGTNASPDDIANVVMAKLSNQNRGNLRSNRY